MRSPITVLIADDHEVSRIGIRYMLSKDPDIEIVGEATDGGQAILLTQECQPQVVLMDVRMPLMSGIDALKRIKRENQSTSVIMLSAASDTPIIRSSLEHGADGYLTKDVSSEELTHAVRSVATGERILSATVRRTLDQQQPEEAPSISSKLHSTLTRREHEIVSHVAAGLTSQEIAEQLGISRRTVETHRARIMTKLGVNNAAGLVRLALQHSTQLNAEHPTS
ncbi:MAG: response regulator transcription factor [Ignavibacteria bacterium]|nr:response regulator transcription factor [Ignavibacteria bacterium]